MSWDAQTLRQTFTRYFVERGHSALPAAGLIPHDPTVLFNIAGMVQFKPYFEGIEKPPVRRATTVQPCFRTNDIDIVGTTARHNTFFEMLGNFSFGDYFKELAIPFAWELVTEGYGFDPDHLWITVHESDSDASGIWMDTAHLDAERIQRMGDDDNFWKMGETGPCGPSSEIFYDKGEGFGAPGGPAHGGEDRFVEIWNLVFMQYERRDDGSLVELPTKNIDTGAGLERNLAILQGVDSIFETDLLAPLVEEAGRLTGQALGQTPAGDAALRILADHARAATFLISDGVFPSNDGRGYVLRRVIRRAVLRAQQLGVTDLIAPPMCDAVVATMGEAYPNLARDRDLVEKVVAHEEEAFLRTLRSGSALIEEELAKGGTEIAGDVAFKLHDTYGFPIELTTELAEARGVDVDLVGFDAEMSAQRQRARFAGKAVGRGDEGQFFADLRATFGPTEFIGYHQTSSSSRVLALRPRDDAGFVGADGEAAPDGAELFDVVLDVTPFYAEGGGQVGDTGTIATSSATLRVLDTTATAEGITRHTGYLLEGDLDEGAEATATIDVVRRDAIRRNHTATHLLHASLRRLLGEHVKQQGSLVAPDRLRFDFSHFAPLSAEELFTIEHEVNEEVLSDVAVRTFETSRQEAERNGAVAFFGEKYGEVVRVVEADDVSVELCGGTHVSALGMIGPFRILSESSIGANTRRIEATTGARSLEALRDAASTLERAAQLLKTSGPELPAALEKVLARQRALEDELAKVHASQRGEEARTLSASARQGRVVARRDGLDANALRDLAVAVRSVDGVDAVGLVGSPEPGRVALVVATRKQSGIDARPIAAAAAAAVGGGGGGSSELATAGGRDVEGIDGALQRLRAELGAG